MLTEFLANKRLYLLLLLLCCLSACENYPRDPMHTLEKVQDDTLLVGIADDGKWARYAEGEPGGREVALVKGFARQLNATIVWVPGPKEELVALLKENELNLLIGGFTQSSLFKREVAFTRPYFTEKIKLGAPVNMPIPEEIEDRQVYARRGSLALAVIKKHEGKPVAVDSLANVKQLIAAPEEELKALGLQISEQTLLEEKHVLAIPKGENAFLNKLDSYLHTHDKP